MAAVLADCPATAEMPVCHRCAMIPLAVSGRLVVGVAVAAALLLMWVLLRMETRGEAREQAEEEAREQDR